MRILVTGGAGHLGRAVVSGLQREGHHVRILSRRPRRDLDVEWIQGDLSTGEGLPHAVTDVEAIIHAATNSPIAQRGRLRFTDLLSSPGDVDVTGTSALVAAAELAKVEQFIHVSIAGLDHLKLMPYARRKLEAEQIVKSSDVPWSIVRATSFFWLLDRMFANLVKQRILALPADISMAPVDSDEFATLVVECVAHGRRGEREDFAGPQTLPMTELLEQYLAANGVQRRIRRVPLPKKIRVAITAGNTSPCARLGTTTWAQWLHGRSVGEDPGRRLAA
ncbi:MAG: SDR family oxidoreductase [Solirubrobacteraceae bacterium]